MRFVSKPTEIEAVQWDGTIESYEALRLMAGEKVRVEFDHNAVGDPGPFLELLAGQDGTTGWVPVPPHAWVAHWPGDDSDFWPIDNERLQEKYESA